jgi:type II restriction/modification system DNA methylase subunit YeeA
LALSSLEWEPIWGSFAHSYPFPFVKINVSTFHFLPHLLIYLHFVHLKRRKMHSFEQPLSKDSQMQPCQF